MSRYSRQYVWNGLSSFIKTGNAQSLRLYIIMILIGPIADDGVAYLLGRYEEGSFTIDELAEKLKFKRLNKQYFFGTTKAISLLKRVR